ncbi:MAG TPA: c-type cytochrome domain-containing protein, partial [Bryobacteraceae bacterium]
MDAARGLAFLSFGAVLFASPASDAGGARQILKTRCLPCHGAKAQMHGLRLDRRADALRGGESGVPAVTPGSSAESLLIKYVSGLDKDVVMPPVGARLTADEIAVLRKWIDGGAEWPALADSGATAAVVRKPSEHWAFQPVAHPAVPKLDDAW